MGEKVQRLILASSSPRRLELLRSRGFEFNVVEPNVDESLREGESPEQTAARLALSKARAVAERVDPGSCVLAADTIVVLDDTMLGKPTDPEDATRMLVRLGGRTHRVITAYAALVAGSPSQTVSNFYTYSGDSPTGGKSLNMSLQYVPDLVQSDRRSATGRGGDAIHAFARHYRGRRAGR